MPSQITLDSLVSCSASPVAANVAGETVLMSLARNKCYGLGATGSVIWRRLAEPVRVATLRDELAAEYDAEPDVIERDVLELLEELAAEGLIEVRAA